MNLTVGIEAFDELVSVMLLPYEKIRARPKASIKYFIVLTKSATRPPTNQLTLC